MVADFPHHYVVRAHGEPEGPVGVASESLPELATAPPAEFGGPGDQWSPETLLVAAAADCFVLGFRAIARASKLPWRSLHVTAEGTLERAERTPRFTHIAIRADLALPADGDAEKGRRLLEKAEKTCIVTNSLVCDASLEAEVRTEEGG